MIWLLIIGVGYVLPIGILLYLHFFNDDYELERGGFIAAFIPVISWIILVIMLAGILSDWWDDVDTDNFWIVILINNIKNKRRKRKEFKIKLKERDRKIKLGIIRISPNDPYGEENWDDEIKPINKINYIPFGLDFDD